MYPLPPLNALRTFECAARHLNFTKAAEELCVTPGAVSRAINGLEEALQVPLFSQQRRRLQLTAAGQAYLHHVRQALQRLALGTQELHQHRGEGGLLTLGVLPTLASHWLIPQLPDFYQRFPQVSVELTSVPSDFSQGFTQLDLEQQGLDMAIYIGQGNWPGLTAEALFNEHLCVVAAPGKEAWLAALAAGQMDALPPLLLHTTRPHVWHTWFSQRGLALQTPLWRGRFEHYFMVIEAACQGLGVALVPRVLVQQALASGRLLSEESLGLPQPQGYYLLYHAARRDEPKLALFRHWLQERLAQGE
ncbi:LysR substrate-binding domain-containing protein [Balneatrix alpica]|uniref:LysR substrate-binding domain-containing protein n=1 Tax=Balneatrix alpica TaxID=75684 RepID=A0ABV5ZBD0_9GAMM|nr:LysR substrate-binding domain-containing protein [Balneatrix alpica]